MSARPDQKLTKAVVPVDAPAQSVGCLLAGLGSAVQAEIAYVLMSPGAGRFACTHAWGFAPDAPPAAVHDLGVAFMQRLGSDGYVHIAAVGDLPAADPLRAGLHGAGVQSVLALPLARDGGMPGLLVFARVTTSRPFDSGQIALLPFAVGTLQAAIQLHDHAASVVAGSLGRADLERIVTSTSNYIAVIDQNMRLKWVNAAFEARSGWSLAEIRDRNIEDIVRFADQSADDFAQLREATRKGEKFHGEAVNRDRYGNRYWLSYDVLPLHGPTGAVTGFVSIETDITQLKELEAQISQQAATANLAHRRLENALSAWPEGVMILDPDGTIVMVNEPLRGMFPQLAPYAKPGVSIQEIVDKAVDADIFNVGLSADGKLRWAKARKRDFQDQRDVIEVMLPDGRHLQRSIIGASDGGRICAFTDVTARVAQLAALKTANTGLKRALDELQRSKHRTESIIENAGIGTWEWSHDTNAVRIGGRWAEMLGYTSDELGAMMHDQFQALLHPDDAVRLAATRQSELSQGASPFESRFRMRHKDGGWLNILSRGRVVQRAADGSPVLVTGVHIDLSRQTELEHQLSEERAVMMQVLETSVMAVVVVDDTGSLTYTNKEAETLLCLTRSEIEGRQFNDPAWKLERVSGGALPDDEVPVGMVFKHGKPVRDIRHALAWPDGTRRILSVNAAPLHRSGGQLHVVASFTDVTDELAATERLEEARRRAEESNRTKSMFLANMSHEIRTPLNGVLGMAEVLEGSVTNADHLRMIGTIRSSGETLLTVLNGILDMSKIEAGKMELEAVPFVPLDLLHHTDTMFSVLAEEKGLSFDVISTIGARRTLLGDPHRIQQILNNLLNNAFKFTEKGGITLKLTCRSDGPLTFEVKDTGLGMPEAQAERVFESFVQADGGVTRRHGGTGLGLSIVKELVALMGGTIQLTSVEGRGTTVSFTLPLEDAEPAAAAQVVTTDGALATAPLEHSRILIADDNATNRLVLTEMLESTGAHIECVENGQQAVDLWARMATTSEAFDMLLLDITMPVLDGLSAIRIIRTMEAERQSAEVPAIAITANAMPHQVSEYIIGGFDSHLSKPFRKADLLQSICSLIGR